MNISIRHISLACVLVAVFLVSAAIAFAQGQKTINDTIPQGLFVDKVWSGTSVNFDILTVPPHQFVAYYDSDRFMTIAQRTLPDSIWTKTRLDNQIEWDSHNYITMTLDAEGHLHVTGNMHVVPLIYYRSELPYDASSLKRQKSLLGSLEEKVTYPRFFEAPNGDLIFSYRDGSSGKGNQIYNRYHAKDQRWSRLLDVPLIDGEGKSNAYIHGPVPGPNGYFHLLWVWRLNPDANANCNISYAKSRDLMNWEKSDGTYQPLPITMDNCEIIDPIPVGQGLLNGNTHLGFDSKQRVVASYHKYDKQGNLQIYNARKKRRKSRNWKIYPATDWDFKWDFGGWGSLAKTRLGLSKVAMEDGVLVQSVYMDTVGTRKFRVNASNLKLETEVKIRKKYPDELKTAISTLPNAKVHLLNETVAGSGSFVLRWETLPRNNDKKYDFIPEPQSLVLFHFR